MASSLPGSTRNDSDSDINSDYPVSMETNELELTDGLRRAKRQVRVFIFEDSSCITSCQKGHSEIGFNRGRAVVIVLYPAQEFLTVALHRRVRLGVLVSRYIRCLSLLMHLNYRSKMWN